MPDDTLPEAPEARRRADPVKVVNLRGRDAELFARVKAARVQRAGCDITDSAIIRAALVALYDAP